MGKESASKGALPKSALGLSPQQAVEGVKERLASAGPREAWEWALSIGRWEAFATAASQRPKSIDWRDRAAGETPLEWPGEADDWRGLGVVCAERALADPIKSASVIEALLGACRPEFFQGAARVAPLSAWLAPARGWVSDQGLGQEAVGKLANALPLLGPEFQEELMELDWAGPRALPRLALEQSSRRTLASGLCHLAGFESAEPLRRALDFLSAKGLSPMDQLSAPEGGDLPIVYAVSHLSEPCARLILARAPGLSPLEASEKKLRFWGTAWSMLFGQAEGERMIEQRLAFAERMSIEASLGPATAPARGRPLRA